MFNRLLQVLLEETENQLRFFLQQKFIYRPTYIFLIHVTVKGRFGLAI